MAPVHTMTTADRHPARESRGQDKLSLSVRMRIVPKAYVATRKRDEIPRERGRAARSDIQDVLGREHEQRTSTLERQVLLSTVQN